MMKSKIVFALLLGAMLCGCSPTSTDLPSAGGGDGQAETSAPSENDNTGEKIAYYESMVNELQQEVLNLKTELYVNRVEYESRMDELEKETVPTQPSTDEPTEEPQPIAFTYRLENGRATITSYTGNESSVQIPATIDGYPVVAIGDRAFASQTKITSVTIPEGVETLAWFVFSGCIELEQVTIPSSVQSIGYGALENCHSKLTVTCAEGSYAQQYARSYGLRTAS